MSIFNFFKKKHDPIRMFSSDADKFSTEQIWDLMEQFYKNAEELPPIKSDEYVKSMIERLNMEEDITIMEENSSDGVCVISFSIKRNNYDYVSIAYQLFNPYIVYITTSPYGFAGDRDAFMMYCNKFQHPFPMISIGCRDFEKIIKLPDGEGSITTPMYAVRTCIPLLGNGQDYTNLSTALRVLPIYGYDLRDGFHSDCAQPYASKKSGVNIQLEKLVNIHKFIGYKEELYPANIALYGHAPFSKLSTDIPASLSNPYLQYLNFCSDPRQMFLKSDSNEIHHFRMELNDETYTMERTGDTQLICYTNYPCLYTIEVDIPVKINDEASYSHVLEYMGNFSFPTISGNPHEYGMFKATLLTYNNSKDTFILKCSLTQCTPNEVNASVLAMQIVDFFDKCNLPIKNFDPSTL